MHLVGSYHTNLPVVFWHLCYGHSGASTVIFTACASVRLFSYPLALQRTIFIACASVRLFSYPLALQRTIFTACASVRLFSYPLALQRTILRVLRKLTRGLRDDGSRDVPKHVDSLTNTWRVYILVRVKLVMSINCTKWHGVETPATDRLTHGKCSAGQDMRQFGTQHQYLCASTASIFTVGIQWTERWHSLQSGFK